MYNIGPIYNVRRLSMYKLHVCMRASASVRRAVLCKRCQNHYNNKYRNTFSTGKKIKAQHLLASLHGSFTVRFFEK